MVRVYIKQKRPFTSFSFRGRGRSFRPAVEVLAVPHAAEETSLLEVSTGCLPQFGVVYDYSGDCRVSVCSPIRDRILPKVASSHVRSIFSFYRKNRFSIFRSKHFSWGCSEIYRNPVGSKSDPPYSGRDTGSDFVKRDRANKRLFELY